MRNLFLELWVRWMFFKRVFLCLVAALWLTAAGSAFAETVQPKPVIPSIQITDRPPMVCPSWGCGTPAFKSIPIRILPVKPPIFVPNQFPKICPSWGCGTPPFLLVPVQIEGFKAPHLAPNQSPMACQSVGCGGSPNKAGLVKLR